MTKGGSEPEDTKRPWLLPVASVVLQAIAIAVAIYGIVSVGLQPLPLYLMGGIGAVAPVAVLAWDEYDSNKNSKPSIAGIKHGNIYLIAMVILSLIVAGTSLKAIDAKSTHNQRQKSQLVVDTKQRSVVAPPYRP